MTKFVQKTMKHFKPDHVVIALLAFPFIQQAMYWLLAFPFIQTA